LLTYFLFSLANFVSKTIQWNFSKLASTGTRKYGRSRGVAGFVRLLLQRIVHEGLKKSADIQGGPVFWGSGLEKFHCIVISFNQLGLPITRRHCGRSGLWFYMLKLWHCWALCYLGLLCSINYRVENMHQTILLAILKIMNHSSIYTKISGQTV
jgi:hypothetical protein